MAEIEVDEQDIEERGRRQLVANVERDLATIGNLLPEMLALGEGSERAEAAAIVVLDKYLPQPQLLDKHLHRVLAPLIERILLEVRGEDKGSSSSAVTWRFVAALCRVRTGKALIRRFPNDPPLLVQLLRYLNKRWASLIWEARYVSLLWLSLVLAAPYSLTEMLSGVEPGVEALMRLAEQGVAEGGRVADAAARVLARLATRADGAPRLAALLAFAAAALPPPPLEPVEGALGALRAALLAFKHGDRAALSASAPQALQMALALQSRGGETRKATLRLILYAALSLMSPRTATWRYQRSVNVLFGTAKPAAAAPVSEAPKGEPSSEIRPEVGQATGQLLAALQERDTVVRWTAAKGLARIALRLPQAAAEQLISTVLALLTSPNSAHTAHGALLTTAELARRGLVLPARLDIAVQGAQKGLAYEELKGSQPIGADVRDAAAFLCWSFSRAYDSAALAPHAPALAESLLRTALFDRQLSVRRAAAAALQEACGRLPDAIPHALVLSTSVDFAGVGPRADAYLQLAPRIAALESYRTAMLHEAWQRTRHWDSSIRSLAAQSLGKLVPLLPHLAVAYIPQCTQGSQEADLAVRQGSLLALSALVRALHECKALSAIQPDAVAAIVGVVPALERNRLYRGKGGESVRTASAELIGAIAHAALPLAPLPAAGPRKAKPTREVLLESLEEHLRQPSADLTEVAVASLAAFSRAYLIDNLAAMQKLLARYCAQLKEINPAVRRAYALALGALPAQILAADGAVVIRALSAATQLEADAEARDAESRRNAVHGLGQVLRSLGSAAVNSEDGRAAVRAMLAALEDHSTDERGDVGSWVREAALEKLGKLFEGGKHLCEGESWRSEASTAACAAVRSALERLDKLRLPALRVLFALLSQELPLLPDAARLRTALPPNANWSASPVVFAQLSPVLLSATYAPHVVEGIACSIGGLGRGHALEAGGSLERVLRNASAEEKVNAARVFCDVTARHSGDGRLASPLLRTMLFLVQGPLADLVEFRARLLEILRAQVKGCTDVPRLLLIVECAAALARQVSYDPADEVTRTAARGALLFFLTHAYAKVRVAAAEALLVLLTDSEGSKISPSKSVEAMEALRSAAWAEGPVSALQPVRQRLYELCDVPKPAAPSPAAKAETK